MEIEKNVFWAIRGAKGGFYYKNDEAKGIAIFTKRVYRRWSKEDGVISASNNVLGWYTENYNIVMGKEHSENIFSYITLPRHELPILNSVVCYDQVKARYYKKGSGFTARNINAATHFTSFEISEEFGGLEELQFIELASEIFDVSQLIVQNPFDSDIVLMM